MEITSVWPEFEVLMRDVKNESEEFWPNTYSLHTSAWMLVHHKRVKGNRLAFFMFAANHLRLYAEQCTILQSNSHAGRALHLNQPTECGSSHVLDGIFPSPVLGERLTPETSALADRDDQSVYRAVLCHGENVDLLGTIFEDVGVREDGCREDEADRGELGAKGDELDGNTTIDDA
jgi:hypothetical protein